MIDNDTVTSPDVDIDPVPDIENDEDTGVASSVKRTASDIIKAARARNTKRSAGSSGKKESAFSRLKHVFSRANEEASVDTEGKPSKFKRFTSALSTAGHAVKNSVTDFGRGIKGFAVGMHDSFAERHAKTKWSQISDQFSDDEILSAAKSIKGNSALQDALDTVHDAGYITAGGAEYLKDLEDAKRLNEKGYDVKISSSAANMYIPDSYGGKLDAKVQVGSFDGLSAKDPVADIAAGIRKKLGDSAQRGKDVLIDESIDAVANIAHSLDRLKAIAERDDLPESAKTFFGGEQWQAIRQMLDGKNDTVESHMNKAIGKGVNSVEVKSEVKPDVKSEVKADAVEADSSVDSVAETATVRNTDDDDFLAQFAIDPSAPPSDREMDDDDYAFLAQFAINKAPAEDDSSFPPGMEDYV